MNVSALAGGMAAAFNSSNNPWQVEQEWQSLGKNLNSGNLSAAQGDFKTLQKLSSLFADSSSSSSSQLSKDIAALGSALDSGSLDKAQSAYSTVKSDLGGGALQAALDSLGSDRQTAKEIRVVTSAIDDNGSSLSSSTSSSEQSESESSVSVYA